ncbi:MAG: sugar phosphate isomerase/epimerase [Sedimentisphaerales bacterium]|nr:sugar phosphate isomerase/epimerase [Sedimentisphaerales bacterium]
MKIGVMVESFRQGLDGGLKAAQEVGAHGIQMYAIEGETHPDNLKGDKRKELLKKVRDMGLEFSAICADFGHGFGDTQANPKLIEDSKKVVDLTVELDCKVVTTHIGVVPADRANARYDVMLKACRELAQYGDKMGATFAIETGPEPAQTLRTFLDEINLPKGLGVNFDPANLVMVCDEDIPAAVALLAPYIVHTHAKDGLHLQDFDPEALYGGKLPNWEDFIKEVPLGQGGVDFDTYIPALKKIGFDGYLTVEREVGEDPHGDIEKAVEFLRKYI